jgi:hypothetical protein
VLVFALPVDPQAGESTLTTIQLTSTRETWNLSWNDTEDVLRGSIAGHTFRVGEPIVMSLNLNSYNGGEYGGPLTVSLRPLLEMGGGESHTVERNPKDRLWAVTFTPQEEGDHRLEVSFRTTHLKSVRATLEVSDARVPPWVGATIAAALILMAVGAGAWLVSRGTGQQPSADARKSDPPA